MANRFDELVGFLEAHIELEGAFDGMNFYIDKEGNWGFTRKASMPNSVMVEDWERYYKFDAAKEYDNPSEFVAECIIEEALNKLEMEAYYEEMIDALETKHSINK